MKHIPSIGDIVHFHPTANQRLAAIVVETYPLQPNQSRPDCDLSIFTNVKGQSKDAAKVPGLLPDPTDEPNTKLKNFWTFKDEYDLTTPTDKEPHLLNGTNSNINNNNNNSIYGEH